MGSPDAAGALQDGDGVLRRLTRAARREDGQAIVELALALPILLIVLLGIVDFGRAINYWNDENSLANIGARYAAVGSLPTSGPCTGSGTNPLVSYLQCEAGQDSPELENGSSQKLSGQSVGVQNGISVKVCVPSGANSAGQQVTVQVTANYNLLPLPKVLGGSTPSTAIPLTGSATMRIENSTGVPASWVNTTTASCT